MFQIFRTSSFKKDYKKLSEDDKSLLKEVISQLAKNETLDKNYRDHKLIGNYNECRECHIKPNLLLIYKISEDILELALVRIGNHSELFKN